MTGILEQDEIVSETNSEQTFNAERARSLVHEMRVENRPYLLGWALRDLTKRGQFGEPELEFARVLATAIVTLTVG